MGIHPAVKHQIGILGLDGGQNGLEIGRGIGGVFTVDDRAAFGLDRSHELIGQALAIGGAVVNDRNVFGLGHIDGIVTQRLALLNVIGNHPEGGFKALASIFRIGSRWRDLWQAGICVDSGGGDGGARVQMADDANYTSIDQTLGNLGADFWVALVIFGHQFKLDFFATNFNVLGIEIGNCQFGAIFIVFAQMRYRPRHWRHLTNFDNHLVASRRRCRAAGSTRGIALCVLAAGGECQCSRDNTCQMRNVIHSVFPILGNVSCNLVSI